MLKVLTYPDPILRRQSEQINAIDDGLSELFDNMTETMYIADGVGLAAPQIGVSKQLFVVDAGEGPMVFLNPEIIRQDDEQETVEEGCLSLPGIHVDVTRARRIVLRSLDESGRVREIEADGLLARVFQHEIDHLNGVLIIDHASSVQRALLRSKLRKLEKES